jgi:hypothetical protein
MSDGPVPVEASVQPRHDRRGLYLPWIIAGVLAAGWTAFWFIGRTAMEKRVHQARDQAGGAVSWSKESFSGYPLRLSSQLEDARLKTARGELSVPALSVHAMPTNPNHVIVEWRSPLKLTDAGGVQLEVASKTAAMSVRLKERRPTRVSLRIDDGAVTRAGGARAKFKRAAFHLEALPAEGPNAARVLIGATGFDLGGVGLAAVLPSGTPFDRLQITALAPDGLGALPTIGRAGDMAGVIAALGPMRIAQADLADAGWRVSFQGDAVMTAGGVTAKGELRLHGVEALVTALRAGGPDGERRANALTAGVLLGVRRPDGSLGFPIDMTPGQIVIAGRAVSLN